LTKTVQVPKVIDLPLAHGILENWNFAKLGIERKKSDFECSKSAKPIIPACQFSNIPFVSGAK
jgi:hypothetical protein